MSIYIVCWMIILEKPDKDGNTHKDHYKDFGVLNESDSENHGQATEFYAQLCDNKQVYSANLCKVVSSTDY